MLERTVLVIIVMLLISISLISSSSIEGEEKGNTEDEDKKKPLRKPIAWIHIGPHKTATTHFQSHLNKENELLRPFNVEYHRKCDGSSIGLKSTGCINGCTAGKYECWDCYLCFADGASKRGNDIILSSEDLSVLNMEQIKVLQFQLEGSGFTVRILTVYRELTQLLFSHYIFMGNHPWFNDGYIGGDRAIVSFLSFLFKFLPVHGGIELPYNFQLMVDTWISVFGTETISIIDYYGSIRANRDIVDIFLCDIAKITCDFSNSTIFESQISENIGDKDILMREIFDLIRNYLMMEGEGFRFDTSRYREILRVITKSYHDYAEKIGGYSLPVSTAELTPVIEYARELDLKIGEKYKDLIIFRNSSANVEGISGLKIKQLDPNVLGYPLWRKWFKELLVELKESRLVNK